MNTSQMKEGEKKHLRKTRLFRSDTKTNELQFALSRSGTRKLKKSTAGALTGNQKSQKNHNFSIFKNCVFC